MAAVCNRARGCSAAAWALLAAAIEAVAFLPVFYAHLALNDVPTLAPLTLSLLGTAGVLRKGRARDYLLAGVGLGLACASKYTAGIVLVPFAAAVAARYLQAQPDAGRRALGGIALAGLAALGAFLIANPYAILDYSKLPLRTGPPVDAVRRSPGQARRAQKTGGWPTTCGRSPGGSGWVPALAALGGAVSVWRRERALGWLLVPAPLLYLAFMGLQGRYFGRWLLPIFPILCLLAALFAVEILRAVARALEQGKHNPRVGGSPAGRSPLTYGLATLLVLALLAQGLIYSVHSGLVLARADTRNLTRDWMLAHIPAGAPIVVEPVAPDAWGTRWNEVPVADRSPIPNRGTRSESDRKGRHRGLRAHARSGTDRLLRSARLLLGGERLDRVRTGARRPEGGAGGDRLLPRAGAPRRSRLPGIPVRAGARSGRVRLRLELRLLPARLRPSGAGYDGLPAAGRALRAMIPGRSPNPRPGASRAPSEHGVILNA